MIFLLEIFRVYRKVVKIFPKRRGLRGDMIQMNIMFTGITFACSNNWSKNGHFLTRIRKRKIQIKCKQIFFTHKEIYV